jgi:hypothetical protein
VKCSSKIQNSIFVHDLLLLLPGNGNGNGTVPVTKGSVCASVLSVVYRLSVDPSTVRINYLLFIRIGFDTTTVGRYRHCRSFVGIGCSLVSLSVDTVDTVDTSDTVGCLLLAAVANWYQFVGRFRLLVDVDTSSQLNRSIKRCRTIIVIFIINCGSHVQ